MAVPRLLANPVVRRLAVTLTLSAAGLAGLSTQEGGAIRKVYADPVGIATVCTGSVTKLPVGTVVSQDYCAELLRKDTTTAQAAVKRLVKVPISQNQYDALVDFTFNEGEGTLGKSELLRQINAGHCKEAGALFGKYNTAKGVVLRGLTNRRDWEASLWTPDCAE